MALDTLRVSKRLREAGFSEPQADAVTGIIQDARDSSLVELSTKTDLRDMKSELKLEIGEVRLDLSGLRSELAVIRWMLGTVVAGVVALILKTFFS